MASVFISAVERSNEWRVVVEYCRPEDPADSEFYPLRTCEIRTIQKPIASELSLGKYTCRYDGTDGIRETKGTTISMDEVLEFMSMWKPKKSKDLVHLVLQCRTANYSQETATIGGTTTIARSPPLTFGIVEPPNKTISLYNCDQRCLKEKYPSTKIGEEVPLTHFDKQTSSITCWCPVNAPISFFMLEMVLDF